MLKGSRGGGVKATWWRGSEWDVGGGGVEGTWDMWEKGISRDVEEGEYKGEGVISLLTMKYKIVATTTVISKFQSNDEM